MSADPQREADQIEGVVLPEARQSLAGHEHIRDQLKAAMASRRMPGGILLHGPRGIGKATLAFGLARDLLAASGDEDVHRVAEQIAEGVHPNVFVLRKILNKAGTKFRSEIVVEQVAMRHGSDISSPLIDRLRRTRGRPGYRICVVDAIDDCNRNTTNALLKILEEPPPETLFILISHQPGSVLPTIRSRCQSMAMRPIGDDALAGLLRADGIADATLADVVGMSGGRVRRAYELLMLEGSVALNGLRGFLAAPAKAPQGAQLTVADGLAAASEAERLIAREIVFDHIAEKAREAANAGVLGRNSLASASALWEKADPLFTNADIYNLDTQQTFVMLLDAIRSAHLRDLANMTDAQ